MEHNMLGVAIFCGLYYAFAGWRPLYLTHSIWLFPLTSALPIGLLMGDVKGAMILGAAISMLYVGLIAPGAEISADSCAAGIIGAAVGLAIGADTGTAIAIAVPFGVLGVFLNTLRRIINARYGTTVIDKLVDVLPAWVMTGFSVAGGMMPAIGFAILINVIGKRSILPFFFIGFFIVKIFGCSALQLACLGIPMAIAIVLMTKDSEDATVKRALAATASDDDDDE